MSGTSTPRVDPDAVRATLRAAGLRARHALSQNFLADPDVLDAILAEADPPPGRRVAPNAASRACRRSSEPSYAGSRVLVAACVS